MEYVRTLLIIEMICNEFYSDSNEIPFYIPDGWKALKEVNMFDDSYIHEVNAAYWAEEEELRAGIHPSQVKERIKKHYMR